MAIPSYEDLMLPLLRFAGDGAEHALQEAYEGVARGASNSRRKIAGRCSPVGRSAHTTTV
jgi:restriction endonuclease Mrr